MTARRVPVKIENHPAPAHLSGADPVLARIIEQVGGYRPAMRPERFPSLTRAIIFQQLAGRAALAIMKRFVALYPGRKFPTPQQVLDTPITRLRKAGLSTAKARYIKELAAAVAEGRLNFRRFPKMQDEEIIEELTQVPGIGRWTAEMFLMFNLGRPDVLPVGDLGFRNAVMKAYELKEHPSAKEIHAIAENWRPHRSAAVWYLWQSLNVVVPDAAPKPALPAPRKPRRK